MKNILRKMIFASAIAGTSCNIDGSMSQMKIDKSQQPVPDTSLLKFKDPSKVEHLLVDDYKDEKDDYKDKKYDCKDKEDDWSDEEDDWSDEEDDYEDEELASKIHITSYDSLKEDYPSYINKLKVDFNNLRELTLLNIASLEFIVWLNSPFLKSITTTCNKGFPKKFYFPNLRDITFVTESLSLLDLERASRAFKDEHVSLTINYEKTGHKKDNNLINKYSKWRLGSKIKEEDLSLKCEFKKTPVKLLGKLPISEDWGIICITTKGAKPPTKEIKDLLKCHILERMFESISDSKVVTKF